MLPFPLGGGSGAAPQPTPTPEALGGPVGASPNEGSASVLGAGDLLTSFAFRNIASSIKECQTKKFKAHVTHKGTRSATFMVDGKKFAVVRKKDVNGHLVAIVDPVKLKLAPGPHKLTARVRFRAKGKKPRLLTLRFRRCDQCSSRRSFRIRVKNGRRGERAVRAVVYVNGKRAKVVRGKRLRSRVVLTGLPKGRYTVRIRMRTNRGRTLTDTRRYRTCTKKIVKPKKPARTPAV